MTSSGRSSTVLVVGEVGDWSADTVASAVEVMGGRVFRLTTYDFPQRMSLGSWLDGGWAGKVTTADGALAFRDVAGVYYRRPRVFDLPAGLSGPERRFCLAQARIGLGGILASLPARWISHPSALADCEYKPWQLAIAAKVGMLTPATLVTNNAAEVGRFAAEVGDLVVKPLAESSVAEGGTLTVAYTRRLDEDDYQDLRGVQVTAHLFQQWIEPRYAVRLTAVGDRLFPVAIHPGSDAARVDWRADYDHLTYDVVDAPEQVAAGVARFLAEFGLGFGAFDFIVQRDTADWYFMECNASGQWGWLAEECGLPIAETIAAQLLGAGR